jgi:hypothetical protein
MEPISYSDPRVIYYGPQRCRNCGVPVVRAGTEFGGNTFALPDGPIYPNTKWEPHVCDPTKVVAGYADHHG